LKRQQLVMSCCNCCSDKVEDAPDVTHGPKLFRRRGCTDVLCLLLFIAFWFGTVYISWLSIYVGKPWSVLYGADYLGNRCGRGEFSDRPKTYFPRIDEDILAQADVAITYPWRVAFYGLCVDECPNVSLPEACFSNPDGCKVYDYGPSTERAAEFYYATLPSVSVINRCIPTRVANPDTEPDRCAFPQCDNVTYPWMTCDPTYPTTWLLEYPYSTQCEVKFSVATTRVLAPMVSSPLTDKIREQMSVAQEVGSALMDAILEMLAFGVLLPLCLGFLWLILLRFAAKTITYFLVVAVGLLGLLLTCYFFVLSGDIQSAVNGILSNSTGLAGANNSAQAVLWANDTFAQVLGLTETVQSSIVNLVPTSLDNTYSNASVSNPSLWRIAGIIMLLVTVLYFISMCMARKRIRTAVSLVKESTVVIADRPSTMLFPVNTLIVQVAHFVFMFLVFAFLSTADINDSTFSDSTRGSAASTYSELISFYNRTISSSGVDGFASIESSSSTMKYFLYAYLIFGFIWTYVFIYSAAWTALSGSVCHWYFFRQDESAKTRWPLARSLCRVFRYHLGTIAAGSLIITIVKFIRLLLMALDRATEQQQKNNLLLRLTFKCVACCLYCLEKTLQYITAYCYIYTAMQGSGFCSSCFATFNLIMKYPLQLSINSYVRWILGILQLLSTPLICGWGCNIILWRQGKQEPVYATGFVVVSSYIIAKACTTVFTCVIDTIFVCCARDMAEYKGAFLSERLRSAFGFDKKNKKKASGNVPKTDATVGG